jgi:hypothetical protein
LGPIRRNPAGGGTPRAIEWDRHQQLPDTETNMTRTLTLPRRRLISRTSATRPAAERVLRDVAFVLAMARRVGDEIRSAGRPRTAPVV